MSRISWSLISRLRYASPTAPEADPTLPGARGQRPEKAQSRAWPPALLRFGQVSVVAIGLLAIFVGRYWYDTAPLGQPELGISFSCRQAQYLGEDCDAAFAALLDDVGVRHVRLSLYWSDVEKAPGQYDFSVPDRLLTEAQSRGADVLFTVGIKAQRYPEVYVPEWLTAGKVLPEGTQLDKVPGVRAAALAFVGAAVQHYAGRDAVVGWQVENEPFLKNFDKIHGWTISPEMTADEAGLVRQLDPLRRPVVVTHSSWTVYDSGWKEALKLGDVLGQNVFTKKAWLRDWWYFFPYRMGPWVPDLPGQAASARRAGKQFWITELQAEPEERLALTELRPDQVHSISPRILRENLTLARRSGASRVYLWGAEWWYAERTAGPRVDLWDVAREIFHAQGGSR
jgi:hypothetical protein